MVLGISLSAFTLLHVVISLAGIGSGFIVMFGLLAGKRLDGWTVIFLATTILTSLTGFLFPFHKLTPGIIIGVLSCVVLAIAIYARYLRRLEGLWRWIYVVTAQIALYFNVFVGIVQAFEKVPALHALAPTGSEAPFVAAQLTALIFFVVISALALKRFRIERFSAAAGAARG